ncbi:hypothetical protein Patl1_28317 [Pistacia atlantica]|uniref:Uncharacterized protein n=1 Tax=Pistacia atlantica TaxID=434234 RepID=A0ACC1BGY9_9ROSI|nr:hypothetical protein Patl1_28317 [Pistacia atlantica]
MKTKMKRRTLQFPTNITIALLLPDFNSHMFPYLPFTEVLKRNTIRSCFTIKGLISFNLQFDFLFTHILSLPSLPFSLVTSNS